MKISEIDTFIVDAGTRNLCFLKVKTDTDLYGIGEAYSAGPDRATETTIHYFEEWLIGMDPMDIEGIWQKLYIGSRFPGGSVVNSAISGIDHALWDLKGRALNTPVYQLLGGRCRNRIRVYQNPGGINPEETAARAHKLIETYGFTAIKTNPLPPEMSEMPWPKVLKWADKKMALLRKSLGDEIDIGLDPHAKILEPAKAIDLCSVVAPYQPLFVEEPLRPENVEAMAYVRSKSQVPIATGEMLYTKWEFRDLLHEKAVDIIQPDICCCGGVTEMKKIAALAEAEYVTIAPHNPMGPVATAVNAHFASTAPNFVILEYKVDTESPRKDMVEEPYKIKEGYLEVPEKPGFGIELNEEYFETHPYKAWKRHLPSTPDGSVPLI